MNNKKIIIGSGLTGPLLAILLSKKGYSIDIFEKRSDMRKKTISAGRSINLALSHRGIEALKAANIFDIIKPQLLPMQGRMIHHQNGDINFQPYSINSNECIYSVSRLELNKLLINAAENSKNINIQFNFSLEKIIGNQLIFENGMKIDIKGEIFGADGSGSIVRKYIDSMYTTPSYIEPLGHAYKELNIAPSKEGEFQLDSNSLHIWPREQFMLIALPNTDKSFTCTLFMPNAGKISFDSLNTLEKVLDFFRINFNDLWPLLENFPQSYFNNPIGKLGTIYAKHWNYENICLIGDAAHAIVPFFGQGMNASFEDCIILMDCIEKNKGNWIDIFNVYNKKRKQDTDAIAKMAIEKYIEMRDLVTQSEFIARKQVANSLYKKYPNNFIPRYNMVSFSSIPYSEVYKRGKIQNSILSELNFDNLDWEKINTLISTRLSPIN